MSKLQKYNRIVFAIISIPTLFLMFGLAYMFASEVLFPTKSEYDRNNGSISKEVAEKNNRKKENTQYISYKDIIVLNPEKMEFVVPVVARTMEKPERRFDRFGFYEASVDEVVFDEDSPSELATAMSLEEKKEDTPVKRVRKPDTAFLKSYYTEQFVNLVYENDAGKIHKSIMDKRFTGWNLSIIRNGKKRYLAFIGTENDTNKDGYLNQDDNGDLYLYDIDADSMKVVALPNMEIEYFYMIKNTPILIFAVKDRNRPETHKNETFIYRYDLNTGKLEDIIPDAEKEMHRKQIQ